MIIEFSANMHFTLWSSNLTRTFGRCFGEIKFVFSDFFSSEDHSTSYSSWDIQLTFYTVINASEFRKTYAILSILIKTFWISFGERSYKLGSFVIWSYEQFFLARMHRLTNEWLLSVPPRESLFTYSRAPYGLPFFTLSKLF